MPQVPSSGGINVLPTQAPTNGFAQVQAPSMPDVADQQTEALGQGLQRLGGAAADIANNVQAMANQTRVDDALNQVKEASLKLTYDPNDGFTNLKGINALERPNGAPLAQEYGDKLNATINQVSGTLGNDAQRSLFMAHAGSIMAQFQGQAMQHESQEFNTYTMSVSQGVQKTALNDIALNWNNPNAIDNAVLRINSEVYRQAQLLGKSAEWADAQARSETSGAHKLVALTALENNNPAYAQAYLKKYSTQMDANDILAVQGNITKQMNAQIGMSAADSVMQAAQPAIQPGDAERAFNIALGTESGGKQFNPDGTPITSSAGAIGIAQVMPGTAPEAAKLAGLPWDANRYQNDPAYNKAIGLAYFQKQLQDNGGDVAKAYAAYNAGPGRLQVAEANARENHKQGGTLTWIDFMPHETQAYVAKNIAQYNAGGGTPQRPTFAQIDAQLRGDPNLASNPEALQIARTEAQKRYTEQTQAIQQNEDNAVSTAMKGIQQNGGSWSSLPINIRSAVPPKEVPSLLGYAQKIAKGDDNTNLALYATLAANPQQLASMNDAQFFRLHADLSQADFEHFAQERAKVMGNSPGSSASSGPGNLNTSAINQNLNARLTTLGINPTPNMAKDPDGAQRVGAIRQFVNNYFVDAQRDANHKFTDAEVSQHIDALFARNTTLHGWFSNSSAPLLSMTVGDMDSNTKAIIRAAFAKQGTLNPTDAQMLNAYWTMEATKR